MASNPAKKLKFGTLRTQAISPPTSTRAGSEEKMNPPATTTHNTKTGRPVRANAGRKSLDPGYLNTTEVVDLLSEEESEEDVWEDEEVLSAKRKPKRRLTLKRKRSPSPTPPILSPAHSDFDFLRGDSPDFGTNSPAAYTSAAPVPALPPIHLTINIPPGFQGPLRVELDPSKLGLSAAHRVSYVTPGFMPKSNSAKKWKGFLDIPAELRNQIYRHLLVKKSQVSFAHPINFSRTAALLRTCRQVYEEARGILYSENEFRFERDHRNIRRAYSVASHEVGYQQFLRVLKSIGAHNISKLRIVEIDFEDQMPRNSEFHSSREERRYVHDPYLIEGLKMLGQHGQLMKLFLEFHGRVELRKIDYRFLEHLSKMKADDLTITGSRSYGWGSMRDDGYQLSRIAKPVQEELKNKIIRKQKMFPELANQLAAKKD
jgi:hypothetical protein